MLLISERIPPGDLMFRKAGKNNITVLNTIAGPPCRGLQCLCLSFGCLFLNMAWNKITFFGVAVALTSFFSPVVSTNIDSGSQPGKEISSILRFHETPNESANTMDRALTLLSHAACDSTQRTSNSTASDLFDSAFFPFGLGCNSGLLVPWPLVLHCIR